jgi:hypothetical protein
MSHQVINASQIRGNFYGGLPYNVNWNFNGGNTPSTLTISVVNEAGRYSTPKLSFKSESVRIGNFHFNGYLTEYEIKSSASQAILDLTYTDQSIDLDRYFVALRHKHGGPSLGLKNVIYVGKQYHPCDKNLDSTIDYKEASELEGFDNCDPCPFMPEDKYKAACDPLLKSFEIFDVYYTFNELIQKIPRQFNVKLDARKYSFYKSQHIGTLRTVLDSWCGDLGLSYFWDPVKNQLSFIDRKQPIRIPNAPNDREIIDLSVGSTIANTFARGFIGSFEKAAELKDYRCEEESKQNLKCVNVQDLFEKQKPAGASALASPEAPLESDIRELTSIVSYLGKEARTAFLWFWYYQNLGPEDVKNKYLITESKKGEDDDSAKKVLSYLGNMKIIDVYSQAFQETDKDKYFKFITCNSELSEVDRKRFRDEDKKRGRDPDTDPSYYFILAEVDEELAERQLETDTILAREFLGKFWFKKFRVNVPGATNKNSQVEVETPEGEGSAQWYPVDENLVTLPIFGFGHQPKSLIGEIIKDIDKNKLENEKNIDKAREAAKNFDKDKVTLRNLHSFILMERNTKWHIPGGENGNGEDALKWYGSLFQWYKDVSPQIYGNAEGRPDFIKKLDPAAEKNSNYKLFICRDLRGTRDPDFKVEFQQVIHPDEPKKRKNKTEDVEDVYGNTVTINKGPWGLVDNKCIRIKMPGITFFPPVQALGNNRFFEETDNDGDGDTETQTDGDSGFVVYANSSADFKKYIPKQELVYAIDVNNTNCAKIDYNINLIQENNLSKLNAGKCLIDGKAFAAYVEELAQFSAYTQSQSSRKMSFKTAGIFPVRYSVDEGLSAVSIEVSDNGIFTSYTFEDSIVQPPSDSYIDQYMRDLLKPTKSVGYLTPYSEESIGRVRASIRS